jgi:hypothetical protein
MPGDEQWMAEEAAEHSHQALPEGETTYDQQLSLFERHEIAKLSEAHDFLNEIGHESFNSWGDEHRYKSFHFHKCLEPMGMRVHQKRLAKGIKSGADDPYGNWGDDGGPVPDYDPDPAYSPNNETHQSQPETQQGRQRIVNGKVVRGKAVRPRGYVPKTGDRVSVRTPMSLGDFDDDSATHAFAERLINSGQSTSEQVGTVADVSDGDLRLVADHGDEPGSWNIDHEGVTVTRLGDALSEGDKAMSGRARGHDRAKQNAIDGARARAGSGPQAQAHNSAANGAPPQEEVPQPQMGQAPQVDDQAAKCYGHCGSASGFFKMLSNLKAYGRPQQFEAMRHAGNIRSILETIDPDFVSQPQYNQEEDLDAVAQLVYDPGEIGKMGEKSSEDLAEENTKRLAELGELMKQLRQNVGTVP